ncbi:hypothetical protein LTR94_028272, partial [Friedmanniomyces endolithicus]
ALPLAKARNRAASLASGDNLLFLDVDCIPSAQLCDTIASRLKQCDVVVCPKVLYLGPGHARSGWREADLQALGLAHPVRVFPNSGMRVETNPGLFWSLAFAIRRCTFDKLGGFDEGYVGYGAEDTDFGFSVRRSGLELIFDGDATAYHQHHEGFDPPLQHFEAVVANARRFHTKWGLWPMEGWLKDMREMGLIEWGTNLSIVRRPTAQEIAAARKSDARAF